MDYLATWKVLEEMITDFRRKGKIIPPRVMSDLKFARTMIRISQADRSHGETLQKIEEYLANVESYLVSEGGKLFGTQYVDEWLKRLGEASGKITEEEETETSFVSGVPRGRKWIRIKPSTELPIGKLKTLAAESKLSCSIQDDGSFVVHGKDENVKAFVKKMATKHVLKTEK
jgi:hypothetical protein